MKNKTIQYGLMAGLISAAMLLDAAGGLPKASDANRETMRIMKTIKIPPPYTPTYQPATWQQYVPPAGVTPDYSPKVEPVQPFATPNSSTVEPPTLPVTATNSASVSITNVPAVDKTVKTPASAATLEKASEVPKQERMQRKP